ncbi:MAG: hypothetical protein H6667_05665 [Ardenticatenaceae bacterium]|nr:hypothetical protein [Ardenticatenaceae bacterium]MCB9444613.1 hypothetical protein [Ardenticatenaceae bacterium]
MKTSWWLLLGAGLLLVWLLVLDGAGLPISVTAVSHPIIAADLSQTRANTVLPTPQNALTIRQDFVPRWNGLREIELILARQGEVAAGENGRFHLQLLDDDNNLIAEQSLPTRTLTNNQTVVFRFTPQPQSAGKRYTLQIRGSTDNPVSVWGYSLDVYGWGGIVMDDGSLATATAVPATNAQDLRFVTRYQLTWPDAFKSLGEMLWYEGGLLLLALFFLSLPGVLLLLFIFNRRERGEHGEEKKPQRSPRPLRLNFFAWWGVALALGTAVWPLLWFAMTLVDGRWRGWSLWLVFVVGWLVVLLLWLKDRQGSKGAAEQGGFSPPHPRTPAPLLLLLLTLTTATRLLAVRDLSFLPWVDASRHGLITAVMTHSGQMPGSYEPYLPVTDGQYHYGFHAIAASLELMTNWPLNRLLLFLGQLIGGLLPLMVYTAVILMTRRQRPAFLAAFLVGLPFFFPGYYVTWGRLTQLTAMFIMPVLLALTWQLVRGARSWRRVWWLVGFLAAGLFLIHFRVFIFYIPFAVVVWLSAWGRNGRWLAAAGGLGLLLTAPRIWKLAALTSPQQLVSNPIANYNAFPTGYVQTGWEPTFLWLALVALLPTFVFGLRRRRWTWLPLVSIGWTAVLFILVGGDRLGLPIPSIVNLNSLYITFFLPLAIFLGIAGDQLWRWLRQMHWLLQWIGSVLIGGGLLATLLFGVRQQISILNEQTLLAQHADVAGLFWIDENLPETAFIAVNSWKWLGETWAASDGGAWIVPMTGRMTTTPPIDQVYNPDLFQFVKTFNTAATAVADWSDPAQIDWLSQQGVTHIYIGPHSSSGFFDPAVLDRNPKVEMVYGRDGVFIFEIHN